MSKVIRVSLLSILSIITIMSVVNCAPSISQEEYNSVIDELSKTRDKLAEVQDRLAEAMIIEAQYDVLNTQYDVLNTQFEELNRQHTARINEVQAVKAEYNQLQTLYEQLKTQNETRINEINILEAIYDELAENYQELKRQYDSVIPSNEVIDEAEVDQAILARINQERRNNGVNELQWGINLYGLAIQNSREMAAKGEVQYSTAGAIWQDIFWAIGYGTVDQIADAALVNWKVNDYNYNQKIINAASIYGAVATYKWEEVYYITFIASNFR